MPQGPNDDDESNGQSLMIADWHCIEALDHKRVQLKQVASDRTKWWTLLVEGLLSIGPTLSSY